MCFSAEASFALGTILCITGALAVRKVKNYHSEIIWIALIPLFFGIQQLAEGVVWLHMDGVLEDAGVAKWVQRGYLFFAWFFWPVYAPIAFLIPESKKWTRVLCGVCFLIGVGIVIADGLYWSKYPIDPTVMGRSIYYPPSPMYGHFFYGFSSLAPIFCSSVSRMWIFATLLLIAFLAAQFIWAATFTSVWCFFVAVASIVLLKILPEK